MQSKWLHRLELIKATEIEAGYLKSGYAVGSNAVIKVQLDVSAAEGGMAGLPSSTIKR